MARRDCPRLAPVRLPVVLTRNEVRAAIRRLHGIPRLMAILMYGSGLRLLECARLRVKDVDFARRQLIVRAGKGDIRTSDPPLLASELRSARWIAQTCLSRAPGRPAPGQLVVASGLSQLPRSRRRC